jgi:hypothetical protein
MEYGKIISVTGMPGLFELVSSKNDGAIVRSLADGATTFVSSRKHQFSHVESIEIYTESDNVNLVEIFQAMQASTEALPNPKDNKALAAYFKTVYPAIDLDRVYTSDMKKMVKWFELLNSKGVEFKLSQPSEETEEAAEEAAQ